MHFNRAQLWQLISLTRHVTKRNSPETLCIAKRHSVDGANEKILTTFKNRSLSTSHTVVVNSVHIYSIYAVKLRLMHGCSSIWNVVAFVLLTTRFVAVCFCFGRHALCCGNVLFALLSRHMVIRCFFTCPTERLSNVDAYYNLCVFMCVCVRFLYCVCSSFARLLDAAFAMFSVLHWKWKYTSAYFFRCWFPRFISLLSLSSHCILWNLCNPLLFQSIRCTCSSFATQFSACLH